jgi:ABC-type transport system involved in multi-copper enzyme maturation permease subunit
MARLTGVELRKMTDTRAGFWLLAGVELLALGMTVIQLATAEAPEQTLMDFFAVTLYPVGIVMPLLGILLVTSEWSQRTALTTFALVPQRWRVLTAKLMAGVVLAMAVIAASLATAAAVNGVSVGVGKGDGDWTLELSAVANGLVFQLANMLIGLAFGMLLLNSPAAIVLYLLLPTVWAVLVSFIDALQTPAEWLDINQTFQPLIDNSPTREEWERFGASVFFWGVLPFLAGLLRVLRREVK